MRRFKRTLGGSGPPLPLLPVAKPKAGPLHEGFAIPVEEETPNPEASVTHVRDRSNGEANPYSRGNSKAALAAASDRAKCQQILAEGALADSSRGPLASRRSLWAQLAIRAGYPDPFHITPDLMYAVMGALKQAGHRSAYQYLEAAQAQHIALGYSWSPQLQQAKRSAIRSCERFLGNPKQAGGLPFTRLPEIGDVEPLVANGPSWPGRCTILISWWLLREREAAQAKRGHITVDHGLKQIKWRLPSSKTDHKALGAERCHSCACELSSRALCPFHLMLDQLNSIPDHPLAVLFPSAPNYPATKAGWADTFQEIARRLGLPLSHPNGARIYSGHSARVTGARHLAATNVELWRIQLFGRWGSQIFMHYLQDTPLLQMNHLALESSAMLSIQAAKWELKQLLRQMGDCKPKVAQVNQMMLQDCESAMQDLPVAKPTDPWVKNTNPGGKMHRVLIWDREQHPRAWKSRCGWNFGLQRAEFEVIEADPSLPTRRCIKCFPECKGQTEDSDCPTSSSSSSDSSA